jgi:phosphoribosylformylglycinamidine synthase
LEEWLEMVVRILILRAPGTNCDEETARALNEAGAETYIMHTNKLFSNEIDLFHYHGLVFPGGFSYGDRVRAGVIWASKLKSKIKEKIIEYVFNKNPILGICNGFQVLVELGILPFTKNVELKPIVALAPNITSKFETRWVYLKKCDTKCIFTKYIKNEVLRLPVAHSEGRFMLSEKLKQELEKNGQIVFKYAKPNGALANGEHPFNPNGSIFDIAGICNEEGTILGLMPHPERAVYQWQLPNTYYRNINYADGWYIFRSMIEYIKDKII